jgi:hypothetical protein
MFFNVHCYKLIIRKWEDHVGGQEAEQRSFGAGLVERKVEEIMEGDKDFCAIKCRSVFREMENNFFP